MSFAERREKLRELLDQRALDAILVSYASNRYYLSGFELHDVQLNESSGCLIISRSGRDVLCTDARYTETAGRIWPENDIVIYRGDIPTQLRKVLRAAGTRIGFEANSVSATFARSLSTGLSLEACDGMVEQLRKIKDKDEIMALKQSFALNHAMLKWVPTVLREGISESELAWKIERYFRDNGASELAFPSIVAYGKNGALPHAVPSNVKLVPNTAILIDVGCRVSDYCSDQTRTFWFGDQEEDRYAKTRALVAEAQQVALDKMSPGMPMNEVYGLAWNVFRKAGVEKNFTHGLGHGVGLDTHERPYLSTRYHDPLQPGMTVTVEPGLYYPEWGGVRLEVTTLVTEGGVEIL